MAHKKTILQMRRKVILHYKKSGRHALPWRKVQTPYAVFISELMLQQTQVDRVVPKYEAFMRAFPSFIKLGDASLSEVYRYWQGLGYNRRAKFVRDAAKVITEEYGGVLPKQKEALEKLPGIGPYTAGAIRAFAYGAPQAFVETNLRTVVMHHVYPRVKKVTDAQVLEVLSSIEPKAGAKAREWYAALMDYGAYLKRSGVRINHQSAGYAKQAAFKGSVRQVRGAVLREIHAKGKTEAGLYKTLPFEKEKIKAVLQKLSSEGLIVYKRGTWVVAK